MKKDTLTMSQYKKKRPVTAFPVGIIVVVLIMVSLAGWRWVVFKGDCQQQDGLVTYSHSFQNAKGWGHVCKKNGEILFSYSPSFFGHWR